MPFARFAVAWIAAGIVMSSAARLRAQEPAPNHAQDMSMMQMDMGGNGWNWMTDGVLFANFNAQGGDRGVREFKSQNWFMVSGSRALGSGQLSLKGMLTAEPLTMTRRGYAELFQIGEAYHQLENVDWQHPHDLFSQLAVVWQVPVGAYRLSFAGAPVGEATLGPVAFPHRASASENPTAPLGHHTLDSTHIVHGLVGGAIERGPVTLEGSWFRGREPDEDRVDIDFGALDSWATRVWYRPSASWSIQVSHGYLHQPEELEPGNVRRTTASVSWQRGDEAHLLAISTMVGHNKKTYTDLTAFLSEATIRRDRLFFYGRVEVLQTETEHLIFPTVVHKPHPKELIDVLGAYTGGVGLALGTFSGLEFAVAGDVTGYTVPDRLVVDYGAHPVSSHVFLRIRPRAGSMGRMWNMTMIPH